MSLMKTLARVAAGVMLAKGIGSVMQNQNRQQTQGAGRSRTTGGGILGDLLGQAGRGGYTGREASDQAGGLGGGLGGILGQVLGGGGGHESGGGRRYGGPNSNGASGGLGGLLDQWTRNASGPGAAGTSGGMGSVLGGLAGGSLGGLLGDLLGGGSRGSAGGLAQHGAQPGNNASFGEVFNDALTRQSEPEIAPTPEQNALAGLMLKAMIQAAKSDGTIDEGEKQRLLGQVGDLDAAEQQFIRDQLAAPVDAAALAREVPAGVEAQVYLISLMAIDFDNEREAQYLQNLASALKLDQQAVNQIHQQVGVQSLYG